VAHGGGRTWLVALRLGACPAASYGPDHWTRDRSGRFGLLGRDKQHAGSKLAEPGSRMAISRRTVAAYKAREHALPKETEILMGKRDFSISVFSASSAARRLRSALK
jgi:hypothetical protein